MADDKRTRLAEHPGFLGVTSQGVIAIHADWPIYPVEHGVGAALRSLASYPMGTRFRLIDDIDRCALLVAEDFLEPKTEPIDRRNWHVAVWHEDILEAADAGYVMGVERLSERQYEGRRRDDLREAVRSTLRGTGEQVGDVDPLSLLRIEVKGELVPLALPDEADYEEDDDFPSGGDWLGTREGEPIVLTREGLTAVEEWIAGDLGIPDSARGRVDHLIQRGQFDTVIRELGAFLETEMRSTVVGARAYGLRLAEAYIRTVEESGTVLASHTRILRGELRTCLRFIRNGFAHEIVDLDRPRALALISRLSDALIAVQDVNRAGRETTGSR